ncbi:arylsulfatase [Seonamhaeicola sp.]|uniref:sulfatase family protein n=1 Tax=Seonamhaeicola sp. TaxID=1912245 RepID=UPI002608F840|nr:arylsulfatase [Seonamhaeicola sp.]
MKKLNVKKYLRYLMACYCLSLLVNSCKKNEKVVIQEEVAVNEKPNVIVIYTDDLGYGDVSSYFPESKINTPNIDKLAADGLMFTDAHSPASYCTPSRYSILTGNYCWRSTNYVELQEGYGPPIIAKDENTLGNLFQNNGYKTAAIGKWHVGMDWTFKNPEEEPDEANVDFEAPLKSTPMDQGFDYFFGTSGCTSDDSPFAFIDGNRLQGLPLKALNNINVPGDFNWTTKETHYKDVLAAHDWAHEKADTTFTNRAINFMKQTVAEKKPFFVYLPLSLPHIPWSPAAFVKGKSDAGPRGDLVVLTDYCVGQITKTIKDLGVEDNTIVVFTSDNGPRESFDEHRSAGNLKGYKGWIEEGGHRVPFIVKWPNKVKPNTKSDALIGQVDLYATFASILGSPLAKKDAPDSFDFAPVFYGESIEKPVRDNYIHLGYAVRKGDWKLIFDLQERIEDATEAHLVPEALYNLKEDLGETNNRIKEHPEIVAALTKLFWDTKNNGSSRPM